MPIWRNRRARPEAPPRPLLLEWLGRLALAVQDLCLGDLRPRRAVASAPRPAPPPETPGPPPGPVVLYEAPEMALLASSGEPGGEARGELGDQLGDGDGLPRRCPPGKA